MVWPILISLSVTPGAFSAAADLAMAPLTSRQPIQNPKHRAPPLGVDVTDCLRVMAQRPQRFADRRLLRACRERISRGATGKCDEPAASHVLPSVRGSHPTISC